MTNTRDRPCRQSRVFSFRLARPDRLAPPYPAAPDCGGNRLECQKASASNSIIEPLPDLMARKAAVAWGSRRSKKNRAVVILAL